MKILIKAQVVELVDDVQDVQVSRRQEAESGHALRVLPDYLGRTS